MLKFLIYMSIGIVTSSALDNVDDVTQQLIDKVQTLETLVNSASTALLKQTGLLYDHSKQIEQLQDQLKLQQQVNSDLQEELRQQQSALSLFDHHQKRRFLLGDNAICFFARIDQQEVTDLPVNQPLVFEAVEVNAGGGYNNDTGIFTAPMEGLYSFSVSITSDLGHYHELQVAIMKNDVTIAKAHAHGDSGHLDQGGVTSLTVLSVGDKVSVVLMEPDGVSVYGGSLTTFSGHQIVFK